MAARPTRPTATRLYPKTYKGKKNNRSENKSGDLNPSQEIHANKFEKSTDIVRDNKAAESVGDPTKKANELAEGSHETKLHSSENLRGITYVIRTNNAITQTSVIQNENATTEISNENQDNETYSRNTTVESKAYDLVKEVHKTNETDDYFTKTGTDFMRSLMYINGNPERASLASKLKSETGKPLFSKEKVVVPKATQLHDKTRPKGPPLTPMIMLLNVKGHDDKNGSLLERRRHIIQNVVQKYTPALILIQDFKLPKINSTFWSTNPLPSNYAYTGNDDVSMMYDTTLLEVQDAPLQEFQNILEGLQHSYSKKFNRSVLEHFDPLPKMCARMVSSKQGPPLRFICISWHGKFNSNGGGKLKHAEKLEYFKYLMEFLRMVKATVKLPILIGGNFNVDMHSVEHLVHTPFHLCIYDASMRRTVPGIVDYFIITEELWLNEISWVSLREETNAYHPNGVMFHDPVRAYIAEGPLKHGGSTLSNPQTWQPSRGKGTVK